MDIEELRADLEALFNADPTTLADIQPEISPIRGWKKRRGLDLSYLQTFIWEGSTVHPHTRLCPDDEPRIAR